MNKMKDILKICVYEFRLQIVSKRVWSGYFLGHVIIMKQSFGYPVYADSSRRRLMYWKHLLLQEIITIQLCFWY